MSNRAAGPIQEIGGHIEEFAGAEIREKVMQGSDKAATTADMKKVALWVKDAMDRLDRLADKKTRQQIMGACGRKCQAMNSAGTKKARARRLKAESEEAFLTAETKETAGTGVRYERDGDILFQYYTPRTFRKGIRCYCSLMRKLPEDMTASPTYCECARAFTEKQWQEVLGRPVRVELGKTAVTGAHECRFTIHLGRS